MLIDAVDNHEPAGSVTLYTKADILRHAPAVRMDPHSPALKETLMLADLEGEGPKEVSLVGITGENYDMGKGLSDSVRRSAEAAMEMVLCELTARRRAIHQRENVATFEVWWETSLRRKRPT